MTRVYVWLPSGKGQRKYGDPSIDLDDSYVSFWPSQDIGRGNATLLLTQRGCTYSDSPDEDIEHIGDYPSEKDVLCMKRYLRLSRRILAL